MVVWTAHSIVRRKKTSSKDKENKYNKALRRLCHTISYLLKKQKLVSVSTEFQNK